MSKIININESDLKKIVKKVLTERQQINEQFITAALIVAGAYLGVNVLSSLFGSGRKGLDILKKDCRNPEKMGKKTQSDYEINNIANELETAAPSGSGLKGFFRNSDEEGIGSALKKIKSIPDFCAVETKFKENSNRDLIDSIDSAFKYETWYTGDESWNEYVYIPLKRAIDYTKKVTKEAMSDKSKVKTDDKSNTSDKVSGGGSTGGGDVAELQSILKNRGYDIGSHGVDGKFGQDTLDAVLKALKSSK